MKNFNIKLIMTLLCGVLLSSTLFAQQTETTTTTTEKDGKKKIVIITKKVDDDGNVTTEKIVREGKDAEVMFFEADDVQIEGLNDVNVNVNEVDGEKQVRIRIKQDGDAELIEWNGEGELPEELKMRLKEKGVQLHMDEGEQEFVIAGGNHFEFKKPKACLGVHIGHTIEVQNINGVETEVEQGMSDEGVPILGIIDDSGAQAAGLLEDDIITAINGTTVSEMEDVINILADFDPGTTVSINYLRGGSADQTNATLGDCGNAMHIEEIEKIIEIDEEGGMDGNVNRMVIIKKRDGQPDEIVEWTGNDELGELPGNVNTLDLETIDIFPNPTDGKVQIRFTAPAKPTTVRVVDMGGKEIYSEELNSFNGLYNEELDLRKAAKGMFILTIQQGDKTFSERLMIQ